MLIFSILSLYFEIGVHLLAGSSLDTDVQVHQISVCNAFLHEGIKFSVLRKPGGEAKEAFGVWTRIIAAK